MDPVDGPVSRQEDVQSTTAPLLRFGTPLKLREALKLVRT